MSYSIIGCKTFMKVCKYLHQNTLQSITLIIKNLTKFNLSIHCQIKIVFDQLSHYYNKLRTKLLSKLKTTYILITNEKDILFGYYS